MPSSNSSSRPSPAPLPNVGEDSEDRHLSPPNERTLSIISEDMLNIPLICLIREISLNNGLITQLAACISGVQSRPRRLFAYPQNQFFHAPSPAGLGFGFWLTRVGMSCGHL